MDKRPAAAAVGPPYLPAELIPDIARHLKTLQDFFSLRAACRAYCAALPPSRAVLAAQPPHLLVPQHSPSRSQLALVHLPRRLLLRFREPSPISSAVLASDGARVVTYDHLARELAVTHLLSGERVRVPDAPSLFSHAVLAGDLVLLIAPGWVHYCRLSDGRWRGEYCRLRDDSPWRGAFFNGLHMMVDMRSVNGVLYVLLNTCQLAVAELLDNKVELVLLGGEVDEYVRNAWMESKIFMLGECAGEPLLIFKVSTEPAYKLFRWKSGEDRWVKATSLGRRTLFMSSNGFDAWLGPDSPGVRGDCIYEALPRAAGWSEYSLVDGTSELIGIEYQGAPEVDVARTQVWMLPSLF
ncbi:uncharacterized protein LOC133892090 [Phragmites australis]|uniref:uncharacterized protein LOC133892090 n=1 Tax=Phragmites australis TaxID=29695 RepID=UPI002D78B24C|nr:uncharacterized protein LOC133892090 [Phragmites australis]